LNSNYKVFLSIALLLIVAVWTLLDFPPQSQSQSQSSQQYLLQQDKIPKTAQANPSELVRTRTKRKEATENDPEIQSIESFLKESEKKRATLTYNKTSTQLNTTFFVFTLSRLSDAQQSELISKINSIKTYRRNEEGELEPWSTYLREKFHLDYVGHEIKIGVEYGNADNAILTTVKVVDPLTGQKRDLPQNLTVAQKVSKDAMWRYGHLIGFEKEDKD